MHHTTWWAFLAGFVLLVGEATAWTPSSSHTNTIHHQSSPSRAPETSTSTTAEAASSRRSFFSSVVAGSTGIATASGTIVLPGFCLESETIFPVDVLPPSSDAKKLFNEGRALESQGNMAAALRLYGKVTQMAPRFVYGWSNLGNTQTALGDLTAAEGSYDTAIDLCLEANRLADNNSSEQQRRCNDLYVLLLNRGSLRLNNGAPAAALQDLEQANALRGRPDPIVLQNLARAEEINGRFEAANRDYAAAIGMTANEVSPFWLRSAMVKLQLGQVQDGYDLLKRVEIRFPEAPEVRAASAVFLVRRSPDGDTTLGQQKFLEIPDKARLKYSDDVYLTQTVGWPPAMRETLRQITVAVRDRK